MWTEQWTEKWEKPLDIYVWGRGGRGVGGRVTSCYPMYFVSIFFVSMLRENAKKLIFEAKNLNLINQMKTKTIYLINFNHSMNTINKDKKKSCL